MVKYVLLGGSFNPIHIGHLVIADSVMKQVSPNRVFFIPTFIPPHKSMDSGARDEDRITMVNEAIGGNPEFKCLDIEIRRGGISYTYDTVTELMAAYGLIPGEIGIIIGHDLLEGLKDWHRWEELFSLVHLIVVKRPGIIYSNEGQDPGLTEVDFFKCGVSMINNPVLQISSSEIRSAIRSGGAFRYLLPKGVYEYIRKNSLYLL